MKKQITLLFITISFFQLSFAQDISSNMSKLGTWDDDNVVPRSGLYFNEVWGYVDGSGNEYAVMGSPAEVHFIDITTPTNPIIKQVIGGTYSSIWRDFKSYGNYVYGVHDGGSGTFEGLSIYNMSALPSGAITMTTLNTDFGRAHNIFIDEANARLYVAGSNGQNNGLIVYDLTNPASPVLLKNLDFSSGGGYVHDLFVRNNIAYCNSASGSSGGMWTYNLTDLNNVITYNQQNTGGYNHSSWMTDDNNYVVYATETSNFPLYIVDVSDVMNGNVTSSVSFKEPNLAPTHEDNIAHNPLIKGDYCYVSYYEDGVQVWDISNPSQPILAGFYDMITNTDYNGTSRGVWGVYPFLPSGNILVSDDINGLYVLTLDVTLPVELTEIQARTVDELKAEVEWTTASESNSKEFQIERSRDGISFSQIGTVAAVGNSTSPTTYTFLDENTPDGISYYRLKILDKDEEFEYSEIVNIEISTFKGDIRIFPNPIRKNEEIIVQFDRKVNTAARIGMYDATGKTVFLTETSVGQESFNISSKGLFRGIYFIRIIQDRILFTERILILVFYLFWNGMVK
jgi:choice-of-anchor B domain-containing protein